MRTKIDLLAGIPLLITLAVLGALLVQPSCSASQCKQPDHAMGPTPTIECPSGDVCYEGQCKRSCNAGAEKTMKCANDGDCTNSSLPYCTSAPEGLFCSSCSGSEACIPELNICQPVNEFVPSDGGTFNPPTPGPLPLDSGPLDGYRLTRDAEAMGPPPVQDLTHVGSVELTQLTDYANDGANANEKANVHVSFIDLRKAHVLTQKMKVGDFPEGCFIEQLRTFTATSADSAASLGTITVDTDKVSAKPAVATRLIASFDIISKTYTYQPATIPNPMLELSSLGDDHFASITGLGEPMVAMPWPVPKAPYHVPYKLTLKPDTTTLLQRPIAVQNPPQDLNFNWVYVMPAAGGFEGAEVVGVELTGLRYRIRCEVDESTTQIGHLRISAGLLSMIRTLENIRAGETRPVLIERIYNLVPTIPGAQYMIGTSSTGQTAIEATLALSHRFVGLVQF